MTANLFHAEVLIIGSGAGGAPTAAVLAEAGFDVLVVEEGPLVRQGDVVPFSLAQMDRQYRAGGVTAALGFPTIAYTEGCCAGGGTEINSGLYRRPPEDVLARWRDAHGVVDFDPADVYAICDEVEHELSVQTVPGAQTPASEALRRGAAELGWRHEEIPRWMVYPDGTDAAAGRRRSMTETYLPRAAAAGARLLTDTRVDRLVMDGGRAIRAAITTPDGQPGTVDAAHVVVCGGAIQTPALLQRSGLRHNVGRSLAVHPTVKLTARFPDPINVRDDVPVHQVKEFAPDLSFGGSASGPGLAALALSDSWARFGPAIEDWRRLAVYYAAITSEGRGAVRAVPGLRDPVVTYRLTRRDRALLGQGLARLALLMLEAGATDVYPSYRGAPIVRRRADLATMQATFGVARASVMTVHLCSTVPLGEGPRAATDSHGRVRGTTNVRVNDASLLPDAPGVNPQASVMAVAIRNARHFVDTTKRAELMPEALLDPPDVTIVTGAGGWLGRALGDHMARPGGPYFRPGRLRALVTSADDAAALGALHGVEAVLGDIRRPDGLTALFAPVDGTVDVVHTAGVIHPTRIDDFEEINARGTANVMAAALAAGARRVVHVSSNSPFGANAVRTDTFRNDEPYNPYYGYGRSKMQAELRVADAVARGLDAVIVRPPWFYGPFQPARQTTFYRMVRTGRFPVVGDGRQRRSMVYVDNLVQGIVRAELTPTPPGRAWWIADAEPYEVHDIVATVGRALRAEGFDVAPNRIRLPAIAGRLAERADALLQRAGRYVQQVHVLGEMDKTIACDISVARTELGYAPDVALEEGMRRSIRWCVEQGLDL